jgi:hypothetical protein
MQHQLAANLFALAFAEEGGWFDRSPSLDNTTHNFGTGRVRQQEKLPE